METAPGQVNRDPYPPLRPPNNQPNPTHQNKHLAVIPMVANGRRLGAFLLLFKSEAPPKLDVRLVEEVHQVSTGLTFVCLLVVDVSE